MQTVQICHLLASPFAKLAVPVAAARLLSRLFFLHSLELAALESFDIQCSPVVWLIPYLVLRRVVASLFVHVHPCTTCSIVDQLRAKEEIKERGERGRLVSSSFILQT